MKTGKGRALYVYFVKSYSLTVPLHHYAMSSTSCVGGSALGALVSISRTVSLGRREKALARQLVGIGAIMEGGGEREGGIAQSKGEPKGRKGNGISKESPVDCTPKAD